MRVTNLLFVAGVAALLLPAIAFSRQQAGRPEWDQKKAVQTVQKIKEREAKGQPWDKIAWTTSAEQAIARARREQKPIFVYFFLKKNVGPAAAPC